MNSRTERQNKQPPSLETRYLKNKLRGKNIEIQILFFRIIPD
jgi:hypothetical protein